jgi:8-amino-7-oxononanoate synthase
VLHNFASNDYLGHANHPALKKALQQGAERWGVGSGASHLVTGHSRPHQALEEALAARCGVEAALVFASGFAANTAILAALLGPRDAVLQDKLNHASLIDGGLHSGAKVSRYAHADMTALQQRLDQEPERFTLIVSDGVFSMDGDLAPLPELLRLASGEQRALMIDDAHGFGVLGQSGLGTPEHFSIAHREIPIYMATFGKALGSVGAFVAGSRDLIDYLVQFARPYIYSTALPPALCEATLASLALLDTERWRREKLRDNIRQFRALADRAGLPLMPSETAIQPLIVGASETATALSTALRERGFWVTAIRPPTVPPNTARLRITLSAEHEQGAIAALVQTLAELSESNR